MDDRTAHMLQGLNKAFYARNASSFSRTRNAPWDGWGRAVANMPAPRQVLDVACGNMRFKAFLDERFPGRDAVYVGADACDALVPPGLRGSFMQIDVLDALKGKGLSGLPRADLVVLFGFMHHVPGQGTRKQLACELVEMALPGGRLAMTFWRFADDDRRAEKARASTERSCAALGIDPAVLGPGDYLLGWNDEPGAVRYCHSFDQGEIDDIAKAVADGAAVADRYRADGPTGDMNEYLVLQRP